MTPHEPLDQCKGPTSARGWFDLTGRVALVTGGSRGLGLAMASALGEFGAKIALVARQRQELNAARVQLQHQGIDAFVVPGDLSQADCAAELVDSVIGALGPIDILVNNAGTSWAAAAEEHPLDAWRKVIDLNLTGTWVLTQEVAVRCMIPRRSGHIINIASTAALQGSLPGRIRAAAYHASKGGVVSLTRALAGEWGQYGITVNAICPGFIPSKMSQGLIERLGSQVVDETPLRQIGTDDDLKGVVVLLGSRAARHITGQIIAVDGGHSAV